MQNLRYVQAMTNTRSMVLGLIALAVIGCGSGSANDAVPAGGTASTPAATPASVSTSRTAAAGTRVDVTLGDEISSRKYSAGHTLAGSVSSDVLDSRGRVVIPAGSRVAIEISRISPSNAGDTRGEGTLELTVTSIDVNGTPHDARAVLGINEIPHSMKGRGVTKGEGTDVAVGAAAGALVGQLIGKNTKSTVIGGAVGAVGGGAVAVAGAQRDVIVPAGTHIAFSLPQAITVK
jgi:hypothetical protein